MGGTIVMIHGAWGGAWCWDSYRPFFEERGYHCLVPVLRYHDVAPQQQPNPSLGQTSIQDYASDLEQVIRSLPAPPILMGHSMGGLLAQILAARGLAKAAVLLAPAPPADIRAFHPSMLRGFGSTLMTWRFWRKPVRQTLAEAVYSELQGLPLEERAAVYARFVHESGRVLLEAGLPFLDQTGATRVDERQVTCPLLVVIGAEDRAVLPRVARRIASKYGATASFREFPGHAHMVITEPGWEEIASYIAGWLSDPASALRTARCGLQPRADRIGKPCACLAANSRGAAEGPPAESLPGRVCRWLGSESQIVGPPSQLPCQQ